MRRFSIRALMVIVVVSAVGVAAIRNCSPIWAGAMLSLTFFSMTCSLLGIAFGRGKRRVYWTGFAVLGWVYLILMFVPALNADVGQFLLAPNLFRYLGELLHSDSSGGGFQSMPVAMTAATALGGAFGGGMSGVDLFACTRIGMSIEAFLWAVSGGYIATYFASGRIEESEPGANP